MYLRRDSAAGEHPMFFFVFVAPPIASHVRSLIFRGSRNAPGSSFDVLAEEFRSWRTPDDLFLLLFLLLLLLRRMSDL